MKTQKLVFISALLAFSLNIAAQQKVRTTNFSTFQSWVKQLNMPGYTPAECENEDESSYVAMLISGTTKFIQIRVGDISQFKTAAPAALKPLNYTFDGKNASYLYYAETSMLAVAYPDLELCISVGLSGKVEKTMLENILRKSNPKKLMTIETSENTSSESIQWPASIPAGLKIQSARSIEKLASDGTFKEQYEIKAALSPALLAQLRALMLKYKTTSISDSMVEGKVQLMCSSAETIDQLQEQFKTGEEISFMYYVN